MEEYRCPICTDIPKIPVRLQILSCECRDKQVYCLTCARDSFNLNGYDNGSRSYSLKRCPTCRAEFDTHTQDIISSTEYISASRHIYTVDTELMEKLDANHGKTSCPRNCPWLGFRCDIRKHLHNDCPMAFRFKCRKCKKLFNEQGLKYHLKEKRSCRDRYNTCDICYEVFYTRSEFTEHLLDCYRNVIQEKNARIKLLEDKITEYQNFMFMIEDNMPLSEIL